MALNIKNQEVHDLAAEIATLTGKTMTAVVLDALRLQKERLTKGADAEALFEELMAIGGRCAAHLTMHTDSREHGSLLYDEASGMPR